MHYYDIHGYSKFIHYLGGAIIRRGDYSSKYGMCYLYLLNELPNWSVTGYICVGKGVQRQLDRPKH